MGSTKDLDERPGKVAGKRVPPKDGLAPSPAQTIESSKAWQKTFGGIPIPRGAYRFDSHEEADRWLWEMITRKKKKDP